MQVEQRVWSQEKGWSAKEEKKGLGEQVDWVVAFGARDVLEDGQRFEELRSFYPHAKIIIGSTAGEIVDTQILDGSIIATAVQFDSIEVRIASVHIGDYEDSKEAGEALAAKFDKNGLRHLFLLSDGHSVNGSKLVEGVNSHLPDQVGVTGGLAGDADRFQRTLVGADCRPREGVIGAVGFYGDRLRIGCGSVGGWDRFGPERVVTRTEGNVLYELDQQSALELYQRYLGEQAAGLPGTGLLFPLAIWMKEGDVPVVRTILDVSEKDQSMTFSGDIPNGARAQLMKANFDRLIDGAAMAAKSCALAPLSSHSSLAILISCVGRRLVLGPRTEEEVEAVREVLGSEPVMTGFYSYGEIAPFTTSSHCELHNQTMTITTFHEE